MPRGDEPMAADGLVLRLRRILPAPRAAVYSALSDPRELAKWWGPNGFTAPSVDFDPRAGASYRIAMQPPHGELFHLSGEFREVDPPGRLAYTFRWDPPDPDDRQTLVTLSLWDRGERTEIILTQGEFTTEERRALHAAGWTDSLGRLEQLLLAARHTSDPDLGAVDVAQPARDASSTSTTTPEELSSALRRAAHKAPPTQLPRGYRAAYGMSTGVREGPAKARLGTSPPPTANREQPSSHAPTTEETS